MDKEKAQFIVDCNVACDKMIGCFDSRCPNHIEIGKYHIDCGWVTDRDTLLNAKRILSEGK